MMAGASLAYAQKDAESPRKAGGHPGAPRMGQWQEGGFMFGDRLNLTEKQKARIKEIRTEEMAKMKEIRDNAQVRIEAVLTARQKTELKKLREEARTRMQETMEKRQRRNIESQTE